MQYIEREGPLNGLQTRDRGALRYLLSETLFAVRDGVEDQTAEPKSVGESTKKANIMHVPDFPIHGSMESGILFLTEEPDYPWMGEAEMDAFQKSLAALGFSAQGVGLVNIARIRSTDGAALSGDRLTQILLSRFKPVKIILLGVEPDRLGFEEQQLPFHMATDLQAVTWLYTYSFPDMLDHVDKKRTYWSSIKAFLV